jgi:mannose-1-phosphate guanylyltransferase / mannose-6-phosphate isomerase
MNRRIIPLIMCGGAGTRLWPASREVHPKQFLSLFGARSTFQDTLLRVSDAALFERPVVITNNAYRFMVREQSAEIGLEADVLLEPMRRDSGPAIAAGAAFALARDKEAIVLALAADHVVADTAAFLAACREGLAAAEAGHIVTFGVPPERAATEYGYINPGETISGKVRAVAKFVEKPDPATAADYVRSGYLWNSGNFMFRADVMLDEIARFEPAMAEAAHASVAEMQRDLNFLRLPEAHFSSAPKKSIDYAVMERTKLAAVVPTDMGWSDVGSWDTVWDNLDHDSSGNAVSGPVTVIDSHNSLVRSDDAILTTVVGMNNAIVVSTSDAVLVASRDSAENVKTLVEQLKAQNRREAVEHRRVYRPWGYYQEVDSGPRYQVKRIVVKQGARLSLQKHFHRAEHWVVVKGTAEVTVGEEARIIHENESIYVPIGTVHRLANPGKIPLELIEVQVGSYLGEDDIQRMEDIYGRG